MPTTEHTINDALAALLRRTRYAWRHSDAVRSENTGMLRGSNRRPDILVIEENASPVAIEAEILPAVSVESEAISRLGEHLRTNGADIFSCIAVRLPGRLAHMAGESLQRELSGADDLEMALYAGSAATSALRWPRNGWVRGAVSDLSVLAQSASLPPEIIERAADQLVVGVSEAAGMMQDMAQSHPGAIRRISRELCQEDGEQTRRMAATNLANAFVFHGSLAGAPGELANVRSLAELRGAGQLGKTLIRVNPLIRGHL